MRALICAVVLAMTTGNCSVTGRDLRPHDPRRGEVMLMLFTAIALGGRFLRRRLVGRMTRTSLF